MKINQDIKLIVTDMDGTLLNDKGEFPLNFDYLFDKLEQKGIHFCVASGRQYSSLRQFFFKYREKISFIAENGALLIYDNQEIYCNSIDINFVQEIVKFCRGIDSVGVVLWQRVVIHRNQRQGTTTKHSTLLFFFGKNR